MPDPNAALRVVLVGYGYSSKTFHGPLIKATPGLELVAIAARHSEKVRADLPDVPVVPTIEAAVALPGADLLIIATPNETHAPFATAALNAGKHVIVEKPFTLTLDEARRLAALAQAKNRVLAVFQNRRWDSDFLAARALIASGAIGEVTHFESHYDRYRPHVRDRWREKPGPGSGLWRDLGPHLVDQALQLFGLPERVIANLARQRPGAEVDDWAHVILEYGRLRVILHAGSFVSGRWPRLMIHGPGGSWVKYGLDVQERQLLAGITPDDAAWGEDPLQATWFDGASGEPVEMAVPRGDYRQFYLRVRDAVRSAGANPVPPAQAVATVALIETAIQSAAEGRALALPLSGRERDDFANSL